VAAIDDGGRAFLSKHARRLFILVLFFFVLVGIYVTYNQYQTWEATDFTRHLLPVYNEGYFYFYTFTRILAPHLLSLLFGLTLFWVMRWLNKRHEHKYFEEEEPYLMLISTLVVAYPGCLLYFAFILLAYLVWHVVGLVSGSRRRLPLYALWPSVGFLTFVLIQYWLVDTPLWLILKI